MREHQRRTALFVSFLAAVLGNSHISEEQLVQHNMYADDRSMYPLCPWPNDHTKLHFETDSAARDPAGIPCVLHLSNGKTLAHAFDTHEHFKGAMLEELRCSRDYVGHRFTEWECEAKPPLPTALHLKYKVHCVREERDGSMEGLQQYFRDRYNYAVSLFDDAMSMQMVATRLNTFITSVQRSLPHQHVKTHDRDTTHKAIYLADSDRNPAYIWHRTSELSAEEQGLIDGDVDNPSLVSVLPADFCAVTYSIKSNHYYLALIAGSSMWVFFPICTILAGLVITSVTSAFHEQLLAEQGVIVQHHKTPVDTCMRICRIASMTLVFCTVNAFVYFIAKGVLDIYSYVDGATATGVLITQYVMWLLTSIIYLWTIPTGHAVFYPVLPERIRQRLAFLEGDAKVRAFHRRDALRKVQDVDVAGSSDVDTFTVDVESVGDLPEDPLVANEEEEEEKERGWTSYIPGLQTESTDKDPDTEKVD